MFRKILLSLGFIFCLSGFVLAQQGVGGGASSGSSDSKQDSNQLTKGVVIENKPRPQYTTAARNNAVQGTILLKITFLKTGSIGEIKVTKGLPDGLNEEAIKAARKIKFKPALKNGRPITVKKTVAYSFTIY